MKRFSALMLGGCLLIGATSSVSAAGITSVPASKSVVPAKTALMLGAVIGFSLNICSSKYVKPNLTGGAVVLPIYVLMRATGQQSENYVLVGYTAGAATAKGIWAVINCVKEKLKRAWNS